MDVSNLEMLLDKMVSVDKDYRYMALNDLMRELGPNQFADDHQATMLAKQLLIMVCDKNAEVQNLAVKCFGRVLTNMRRSTVQLVVKSCCTTVMDKTNKEGQMYTAVLKEIIPHLKDLIGEGRWRSELIVQEIIPSLMVSCGSDYAEEVRFDSLDILADLLLRHGSDLSSQHVKVKEAMDALVNDRNYTIVKRANTVMGNHLMFCSEDLYHTVVDGNIDSMRLAPESAQKVRIGALVLAAKARPAFFESHISNVVDTLLAKLSTTEDEELMEAILMALEVVIQKCPVPIEPFVPELQKTLLKALTYDPNYEGGIAEEEEPSHAEEEYDSDYVYSDDDDLDLSWKVRRGGAKALQSLVEQQRGMRSIVKVVAPLLVTRFRDRDEGVTCEVMATYAALVRCVRKLKETDMYAHLLSVEDLSLTLPAVTKVVIRLLSHKSSHIRTACFDVFSELARTRKNFFDGHMDVIWGAVSNQIIDLGGNQQMKLLALRLFCEVLENHEPAQLNDYVAKFADVLKKAIENTKFPKVSSEAVMATEKFCDFMQMGSHGNSIVTLLETVATNLTSKPFDQDAKDRRISCMGRIISVFGEILGEKANEASSALLEHAQPNQTSCRIAMDSLAQIAKSPTKWVLEMEAGQLIDICRSHFTSGNSEIKMSAIKLFESALDNGFVKNGDSMAKAGEAVALIMDMVTSADVIFAQAELCCLTAAHLHLRSDFLPSWDKTLAVVSHILVSSVNPGTMLDVTTELVRAMANTSSFKEAPFEPLIDAVSSPVFTCTDPISRSSVYATAVIVAEIARARKDLHNSQALVLKTAQHISSSAAAENTSVLNFCISLLGEIARRYPEVNRDIQNCSLLTTWLSSPLEDVRTSACQALGAFAVGNSAVFLPFVMEQIKEQPQFLLHSIKEIIYSYNTPFNSVTKSQAEEIWAMLQSFTTCEVEGMRLVVADCLGRSCISYPEALPSLLAAASDPSPHVRHCVLNAFKHIINMQTNAIDAFINIQTTAIDAFLTRENLGKLLSSLTDDDIACRRSSLYVLNALIYHKFTFLRSHLSEIMPIVYDNMKLRKELITEVQMGPFKMEVDKGVDIRSAAYQVMFSMMEVSPASVNLKECVDLLKPTDEEQSGIKDRAHDIRTASYMMLLRLVDLFPSQLLQISVEFVKLLKSQFEEKSKTNAVTQEIEKLGELKKMAVKFTYALNNLKGAEKFPQLKDLLTTARQVEETLKK